RRDVVRLDARDGVLRLARRREVAAEDEQLLLEAPEDGIGPAGTHKPLQRGPRHPDSGVRLVHRAVGGYPRVGLGHAVAAEEAGGAVVAGAGGDFHGGWVISDVRRGIGSPIANRSSPFAQTGARYRMVSPSGAASTTASIRKTRRRRA